MRKLSVTIMLLAGLFVATGCDELEEVTIQFGGYGPPAGYYDDHYSSHDYDDYYYEEVVYEETYYEDSWYYDDWSTGWFDWGW